MSELYELGTPYHCIPVSVHFASDHQPHLVISKEHVNQAELQRLYRDHPWVWFHPECCTPDELLVEADCYYQADDSDADEYDYNFLGLHCEYVIVETGNGHCYWLRDHEFNQTIPPDDDYYYKGLEFIRITVDKKRERLMLNDLFPLMRHTMQRGARRKKRGIRIPGIKMM